MTASTRFPRVLMVLEGPYPSARGGGAETQVRTLTRAMRARRQRVCVVALLSHEGPPAPVARVDGVPVCRLRYPRVRLIGSVVTWLALAVFLFRRRRRYDVWHVHVVRSWAVVSALLGPWLGKRVVAKVSGSWDLERGALAPGAGWWLRLPYHCLRRVDAWQAISRRIAASLAARGMPRARIAIVPNAIDTARLLHAAGTDEPEPRFLFVGRLVEEKDLATLLGAFADIAPDHPRARLAIVGTGPLHADLQALCTALGLDGQVTFAGHRDDVGPAIAMANVGVLPSRVEGLSNALLECMASGLPMVASRISGSEDFVRNGENGWLFEPGDRAGLAACLAAAATAPRAQRREMGDHARATVARQAGLADVLAGLDGLYDGSTPPAPVAMAERRA